jgi:CRP-like cAMP-binding protein
MSQLALSNTYKVWAADNLVYGPVELPTLIQWVHERRVRADTWLLSHVDRGWRQAGDLESLRQHFHAAEVDTTFRIREAEQANSIAPEELRQFDILAGLSNEQLKRFLEFAEFCGHFPGDVILKKGDPGDAVFFVLQGEVKARLMVGGQDQTLARIPAGQFFGEMAMLTQTARSADIVCEQRTRLLRLSAESFLLLMKDNPEMAARILFALASTLANRISDTNVKYQNELVSGFAWR